MRLLGFRTGKCFPTQNPFHGNVFLIRFPFINLGESIEEDDSDSDTSVESQTYDEQLFITEDDDITACEVSDPLLPVREKPLAISVDYSKIIQGPIDENVSPEELTRTEITPIEAQSLYFTSEIQDVDLTTESCDHRLAEHFDEFMKSRRKEVDEIVSYSGQECAVEIPNSSFGYDEKPVTVQSNFETIISDVPTKLPDIIQTVSYGNLKEIDTESEEDKYLSTTFMHMPNYEPESGNLELLDDEILKKQYLSFWNWYAPYHVCIARSEEYRRTTESNARSTLAMLSRISLWLNIFSLLHKYVTFLLCPFMGGHFIFLFPILCQWGKSSSSKHLTFTKTFFFSYLFI